MITVLQMDYKVNLVWYRSIYKNSHAIITLIYYRKLHKFCRILNNLSFQCLTDILIIGRTDNHIIWSARREKPNLIDIAEKSFPQFWFLIQAGTLASGNPSIGCQSSHCYELTVEWKKPFDTDAQVTWASGSQPHCSLDYLWVPTFQHLVSEDWTVIYICIHIYIFFSLTYLYLVHILKGAPSAAVLHTYTPTAHLAFNIFP